MVRLIDYVEIKIRPHQDGKKSYVNVSDTGEILGAVKIELYWRAEDLKIGDIKLFEDQMTSD